MSNCIASKPGIAQGMLMLLLGTVALAGCDEGEVPPPDSQTARPQTAAIENAAELPTADTSPEVVPIRQLTATGLGPLKIGADRTEVVRAMSAVAPPPADPACEVITAPSWPGVAAMIEAGKLTRVTLSRGSTYRTPEGIDIDASETVVRTTYPELEAQPHKYEPAPAKNLFDWQNKGVSGVRFEIGADGRVAKIHGGGPSISYVEGCG